VSELDVVVLGGRLPIGSLGALVSADVGLADGRIAAIADELDPARAAEVVDARGLRVFPGVVDPHVHVSGRFGEAVGLRMLLRAGVTAALDLAGDPIDLSESLARAGCGLTVGTLFPLLPGDTVSGIDPDEAEIERVLDEQLEHGALGLKILGGHWPLTPEATAATIAVCARRGAYCAVHAGTTATGSDVTGLEELLELADDHPVHVAHVNSYCRGQVDDPVVEAARAVTALRARPVARSESYLSTFNGARADCSGGVPTSGVVRTCLRLGGYPQTQEGLEAAIRDGWATIQEEGPDEIGFAPPARGLQLFAASSEIGVSFPVNPPSAVSALALARDEAGFVVGAFGSDGGSIPRNTTLRQGLGLVAAGLLPMDGLLHKACVASAEMVGLEPRRLAEGAPGDVITVDADGRCVDVVVQGRLSLRRGEIVRPAGGTLHAPTISSQGGRA
jgi:hypothetical protein